MSQKTRRTTDRRRRTRVDPDEPLIYTNFKLQSLLLSAESQWRRNKKYEQQTSFEEGLPDSLDFETDSDSPHDAYYHYRILLEWRHSELLGLQRRPEDQFLDFIDPIGSGNSAQIRDSWREYQKVAALGGSPGLHQDRLHQLRYQREMDIWHIQRQLVSINKIFGRSVPGYGFTEYSAMRAAIIEDACRYIGRALHIAARQTIHHPDIPVSWARCFHLFSPDRTCIPLDQDIDDYFTEPSSPSRITRERRLPEENKAAATERRKRKGDGVVSIAYLKKLKRIFLPVAHILASMDVIGCHTYRHLIPPHGSIRPHHPRGAEGPITDNLPRAGRTLMDFPHDDRLTLATLGNALWFQQWGLGYTPNGNKRMLSS